MTFLLFLKRLNTRIILPLLWTFLTIVLLCLPGSALPGGGIFGLPHFDKLVHISLFGCLTLFWALHYWQVDAERPGTMERTGWAAVLFSVTLGVVLEFVQKYLIPNRSFDVWDMVADTAGSLLALLFFRLSFRVRNKIN